jgi:phage-related protein
MGTQKEYKLNGSFHGWFGGLVVPVQEIFYSALVALVDPVQNIFFLTISIPLLPSPSKLGNGMQPVS